jgi:transposase
MPKPGPRTIYKYSDDFKVQAVRLSELPGVLIKDVAESLAIHPFMLSRWRKQVREGTLVTKRKPPADPKIAAELKAYKALQKKHKRLEQEHALLKEFIAWSSEERAKSSGSSTPEKKPTRSK